LSQSEIPLSKLELKIDMSLKKYTASLSTLSGFQWKIGFNASSSPLNIRNALFDESDIKIVTSGSTLKISYQVDSRKRFNSKRTKEPL